MAVVILTYGILVVTAKYLECLPSGTFRYYRRIPDALRGHYDNQPYRRIDLKTKNATLAAKKAQTLAAQDTALWAAMRSPEGWANHITPKETHAAAKAVLESLGLVPGAAHDTSDEHDSWFETWDRYASKKYGKPYEEMRRGDSPFKLEPSNVLNPVDLEASRLLLNEPGDAPLYLSEALEVYFTHSGRSENGKPKAGAIVKKDAKFRADTKRAIDVLIGCVGDLPLEAYKRQHAHAVRDALASQGVKTGTIKKRLGSIRRVFKVACKETDRQGLPNPFEDVPIAGEGEDAKTRPPFTDDELKAVALACVKADDEIRHLIAMQMDLGTRIEEIVGLRIDTVFLDAPIPYIAIEQNKGIGRTVKTGASNRQLPLVGMALWGAKRAVADASRRSSKWLFPRYASDEAIKSTHASNTINSWIRKALKIDKTTHCFRHAMRSRLTAVGADEEVKNAVGGWGKLTEARKYGGGVQAHLNILQDHLNKVALKVPSGS
ncbi:Integrase [Hyphomicrobiales bacterium]|nr:Integrase [Hyphomicrobiales bacterium]CAH1680418.1 Integrase [Hyphomicrobiales bacterium]